MSAGVSDAALQRSFATMTSESMRPRRVNGVTGSIFPHMFFVAVLFTEFLYINIAGGSLRPYHLLLALFVPFFLPGLIRLFTTPVARSILFIMLITVISAAGSEHKGNAFMSATLLALNMGVAFSIAVLLTSGRITFRAFSDVLRVSTILMCGFAIVQFVAFQSGAVFALSDTQNEQILRGFAPAFFTEANTFAKYLLTPMFFFLPTVVSRGFTRKMQFLYGMIAVAFVINFMRSATAAMVVATIVAALWYAKVGTLTVFAKRFAAIVVVSTLAFALFTSSDLGLSDYNLYKFATLFDLEALSTDSSWKFRAAAMQIALEQTLADPLRIWIGNGWGQVYAMLDGEVRQVGGADVVNFFAYNGLFGVVSFFALAFASIRSGRRAAQSSLIDSSIGEGVYFALVANFALGLVSGVNLLASFWVMVGVGMATEKIVQRSRARERLLESRATPALRFGHER